jgi:hypothetical protein
MDRDRETPLSVFFKPFALWTELALRMWGFGPSRAREDAPSEPVKVAALPPKAARKRVSARAKRKPKARRGR